MGTDDFLGRTCVSRSKVGGATYSHETFGLLGDHQMLPSCTYSHLHDEETLGLLATQSGSTGSNSDKTVYAIALGAGSSVNNVFDQIQ